MGGDVRLNLLLTPPPKSAGQVQPWHQTLTQLLMPLGVRTFEAKSGSEAVELIEKHPIHMAVVDTRLPSISGMNVLQLVQRLRDQEIRQPAGTESGMSSMQFEVRVEERHEPGQVQRRSEVRFDPRPRRQATSPAVILSAPPPQQQDPQLLQEALKFNAFSVLSEPVDVNLALEILARAMKRFHQNQWPV